MKDGNVNSKKIGECADFDRAITLTGKQFKLMNITAIVGITTKVIVLIFSSRIEKCSFLRLRALFF